jgi:putative flippase GtrA
MFPNLSAPQRAMVRRVIRYGSVSAISTVVGLVMLGIFIGVLGYPAIWSNVMATAIGTIPSFELNRRWIWAQSGRRSLLRQAVPYGLLSFAGLIVSTFAVHLAADATVHSYRLDHTAAAELANLGAYGTLWLIQFLLCDRILFRSRSPLPTAPYGVDETERQMDSIENGEEVNDPVSIREAVSAGQ